VSLSSQRFGSRPGVNPGRAGFRRPFPPPGQTGYILRGVWTAGCTVLFLSKRDCKPAVLVGEKPGRLLRRNLLVVGAEPEPAFQRTFTSCRRGKNKNKKKIKMYGAPFWLEQE
jgi:hypothetical protein